MCSPGFRVVGVGKVKVIPATNCAPLITSGEGPVFVSSTNSKSEALRVDMLASSPAVGAVGA